MAEQPTLFTIGHSNHPWPAFVSLIARHGVDLIADVRSQPYSRFNPQFSRGAMTRALQEAGIEYVFLGRELGARRIEPESYQHGQARYDRVRELPAFREGLDRVRREIAAGRRVALMCAEKDPLTCHRTILVSRELRADPHAIEIVHILADGSLETMEEAETRLVALVGLPSSDLFRERRELIEQAYDLQAERIAYVEPDPPVR